MGPASQGEWRQPSILELSTDGSMSRGQRASGAAVDCLSFAPSILSPNVGEPKFPREDPKGPGLTQGPYDLMGVGSFETFVGYSSGQEIAGLS